MFRPSSTTCERGVRGDFRVFFILSLHTIQGFNTDLLDFYTISQSNFS